MNRRSFLALLTAGAAALVAEARLKAFDTPRLFGGEYDGTSHLWTPDLLVVPALPPPIDMVSLLSMTRAAKAVLAHIDARLPKQMPRQVIVPVPGEGFYPGDVVLAADLAPARGFNVGRMGYAFVDAGPQVLDQDWQFRGGFAPKALERMGSDEEAYAFLDYTMLRPIGACFAHRIQDKGLNVFAPPVPRKDADESVVVWSRESHLAIRACRVWDDVAKAHELEFGILGARA